MDTEKRKEIARLSLLRKLMKKFFAYKDGMFLYERSPFALFSVKLTNSVKRWYPVNEIPEDVADKLGILLKMSNEMDDLSHEIIAATIRERLKATEREQ